MSSPPDLKSAIVETKRALREAGLQVYEVRDGCIALAERIRDNLILHSGVAVCPSTWTVKVSVRAQSLHFPGQSQERIATQAEELGAPFESRGFAKVSASSHDVGDPSHPGRTIDVVHTVLFERACSSWDEALAEIRAAFLLPRATTDSDNPPPFSARS
jgi:hypothetical protein